MTFKSITISTSSNSNNEDHEYVVTEDNLLSHVDLYTLLCKLEEKEEEFVIICRHYNKRKYTTYIAMKHITSFTVVEEFANGKA